MSIIHDALKKAEQIKKEVEDVEVQKESHTFILSKKPAAAITPTSVSAKTKKRFLINKKFLILPSAIALVVIFIVYTLLMNNYISSETKTAQRNPANTSPLPPSTAFVKTTSQGVNSSKVLILSGIAYEGTRSMAVINDNIYTVGEFINGAEIIKIGKNTVLLKDGDDNIELKVK